MVATDERKSPVGVLLLDDSGRIVFASENAARILDVSSPSIVGGPLDALLPQAAVALPGPDDDARKCLDVHRGGQALRLHLSAVRSDGGRSIAYYVLEVEARSAGTVLPAGSDSVLRAATVSSIMPSILHELRNPLASVTAALEVLIEDSSEGALQDALYGILTQARRANLTLRGMASAGRSLRSEQFGAVDYALEGVCDTLRPGAEQIGVALAAEIASLPLLPFDPAAMQGVFYNLVSNAIAACAPGEGVTVKAALPQPDMLRIEVNDTGCGMSQEVLKRCTEMFFSARRGGGGLGLALTVQSVEGAGGTLGITSTLGEGTQVVLTLPTANARS